MCPGKGGPGVPSVEESGVWVVGKAGMGIGGYQDQGKVGVCGLAEAGLPGKGVQGDFGAG